MTDIEKRLRLSKDYDEAAAAAAARLTAAAAAAGVLDVAYTAVDSPVGPLLAAATPRGLIRLAYPDEGQSDVLEHIAAKVSPRIMEAPERLDEVRRELDEYFGAGRKKFEVRIDWRELAGFRRRILQATARIPFGKTITYSQVADKAGNARASRAAGNALGSNPIPIIVPCHRVVRTGGGLGGYTGGLDRKEFLLHLEGVL
jgi:methylated-DNA-[protein]-cysteine S-methyltransferase